MGKVEAIKALIERGADIHSPDVVSWYPNVIYLLTKYANSVKYNLENFV